MNPFITWVTQKAWKYYPDGGPRNQMRVTETIFEGKETVWGKEMSLNDTLILQIIFFLKERKTWPKKFNKLFW